MSEGKLSSSDFQYVTDTKGEITGAVLSLRACEAFEEYMIDEAIAQASRDSKDEEGIPWEQVKAELSAEGKLDALCLHCSPHAGCTQRFRWF